MLSLSCILNYYKNKQESEHKWIHIDKQEIFRKQFHTTRSSRYNHSPNAWK